MSQQNKQMNTATSSDPPMKRKRGRPRKDENLSKKENSPLPVTPPPPDNTKKIEQVKINSTTSDNNIDNDMVGKVVSGVIEGTFDAGYFLSVRTGNSNTLLRGVVFQPGHFTPISAANDIAPQVKMYTRSDIPIPAFNPQDPVISSQPATVMVSTANTPKNDPSPSVGEKDPSQQGTPYGFGNQPAPPLKNIQIMEKDEVGHTYETTKDVVSESASESMVDILLGNGTIDEVPQGQNRDVDCGGLESNEVVHNELHQTPLVTTNTLQSVESGFKPSEPVHNELNQTPLVSSDLVHNEPKSLNFELHPPPLTVEPQSLPPNPVSEPMDIETENLDSTKNDEDSQSGKPEINVAAAEAAADADYAKGGSQSTTMGTLEVVPSKPEFGSEECVFPEPENSSFPSQAAGVDFGIGDVVPPTSQSHCYSSYVPENEIDKNCSG